jgi:hypothetical protein
MTPERLAELILKAHAKGIPPAQIAAGLLTSYQAVARIIAGVEFQSAQEPGATGVSPGIKGRGETPALAGSPRAAVIRPDQSPIHDVKPPCSTRAGGGAHPSGRFSEARPEASRRLRPMSIPCPTGGDPTGGGSPGGEPVLTAAGPPHAPSIPLPHLGAKEPRGCRYIIGDTLPGADWRYCQDDRMPGSVYCAAHHARCHHKPKDPDHDQER